LRRRFRCYRFLESRASMGAQVRLRCWARCMYNDAYCVEPSDHTPFVHKTEVGETFSEAFCALSRGSDGRETAALRILEVAHELDRRAFCDGCSDEYADRLRAVAARLYANGSAARGDYRSMGNEIDGARAQLALTTVEHPIRREIEEIIGLMVLAHDTLRPFA